QLRSQRGFPHPAPSRPPAGPQPGASQAETNAVLVWLGSSFMISFTVGAALIRALIPSHGPLDVAWHSTFLQVAAGCVLLYAVVVLAGVFSLRRLTGRAFVRGWEFSSAGLALLGLGLAAVAALRFSEAPGELASVFSAVLAAVLGGAAGGV